MPTRKLVPIKVKIGLWGKETTDGGGVHKAGHHKYPDFNSLQSVKDSNLDWAHYIDIQGCCMHYDKCCGHTDENLAEDSPAGCQWGVLIIPKEFATAALAAFPDEVKELTETELEDFYDNKAHAHESPEKVDQAALEPFERRIASGKPLSEQEQLAYDKALNPDDETPGIVKNKNKKWADFKALKNIEIISSK